MALATLGGCTEQPPACITTIDLACQPLYVTPSFDPVYNMTLKTTCGSDRSSCHSATGHMGGMSFETEATAYAALLDGRVMPGDAECSKMIVRTSSPGKDYQMPIGDPLSAPEACALIQWVQAGAPGPTVDGGM